MDNNAVYNKRRQMPVTYEDMIRLMQKSRADR